MPYAATKPASTLPFAHTGRWPQAVLVLAGAILALDPAIWLVNTWRDPAYDSAGHIVFACTVGLLIWSVTSPRAADHKADHRRRAIALLVLSAVMRLASQTLAINTIGAICLIIDVYAVGILLHLSHRRRAISPFWLAATFAFALPLERILQRGIGYPLQQLSADGACGLLSTLYSDLVCKGTRLVVNGVDVMVDLPCSGAGTLMLSLLGFSLASAICRPSLAQATIGAGLTLLAAAATNILRITALAAGLANPELLGGINVMDQPWHDIIGISALLIVCATIFAWSRWVSSQPQSAATRMAPPNRPPTSCSVPSSIASDGWWLVAPVVRPPPSRLPLSASLVVLGAALLIVNLPRTAIDVAKPMPPQDLPWSINNATRVAVPLSKREEMFFTQFGGWARKAQYGAHSLMLVHTTSPLRHLHAPEDCLRGLGFKVQYLGAVFIPVPTAVYRAIAPDGRRYRIDVTFISDQGSITTNVSTAVWQWLHGTARTWTAVQRISPEAIPQSNHVAFDRAVWAALDVVPTTHLAQANGDTIK